MLTSLSMTRLYHCARLIHADLSEYNILVCPSWQVSHEHLVAPDERTESDETLQIVLIDFGMAVEIGHPSASTWLKRDISTVRDFFVKQGIKTLSNEDAEMFVINPVEEANDMEEDDIEGKSDMSEEQDDKAKEDVKWRHTKEGWDDEKEMENLLNKLKESS